MQKNRENKIKIKEAVLMKESKKEKGSVTKRDKNIKMGMQRSREIK